jgi:hypothetical protein
MPDDDDTDEWVVAEVPKEQGPCDRCGLAGMLAPLPRRVPSEKDREWLCSECLAAAGQEK